MSSPRLPRRVDVRPSFNGALAIFRSPSTSPSRIPTPQASRKCCLQDRTSYVIELRGLLAAERLVGRAMEVSASGRSSRANQRISEGFKYSWLCCGTVRATGSSRRFGRLRYVGSGRGSGRGQARHRHHGPSQSAAHAREEARAAGACHFPWTLMRATRPRHAATCLFNTLRLGTEQRSRSLAGQGIQAV